MFKPGAAILSYVNLPKEMHLEDDTSSVSNYKAEADTRDGQYYL